MRIVLVSRDVPPPYGGIQTLTMDLLRLVPGLGHTITLVDVDPRRRQVYTAVRPGDLFRGAATRDPYFDYGLAPGKLLKPGGFRDRVYENTVYRLTRKAIAKEKADLVLVLHANSYPALLAAKDAGVPSYLIVHAEELDGSFAARTSVREATTIQCVSRYGLDELAKMDSERAKTCVWIPNAVPLERYRPSVEGRSPTVITVGRIIERKNIDVLIKAFAQALPRLPPGAKLVIMGDGAHKTQFEALAKELAPASIEFTGTVSEEEKVRRLENAMVFAHVPREHDGGQEGFGIVYLEGMAAGCAVIGTRIGGVEDAVGDAGILIDDPLDVTAIADAIVTLFTDLLTYETYRERGLRRVQSFGTDAWIGKVLALAELTVKRDHDGIATLARASQRSENAEAAARSTPTGDAPAQNTPTKDATRTTRRTRARRQTRSASAPRPKPNAKRAKGTRRSASGKR